eukprot:3883153-Prorocentrum_lima.AAC.1
MERLSPITSNYFQEETPCPDCEPDVLRQTMRDSSENTRANSAAMAPVFQQNRMLQFRGTLWQVSGRVGG